MNTAARFSSWYPFTFGAHFSGIVIKLHKDSGGSDEGLCGDDRRCVRLDRGGARRTHRRGRPAFGDGPALHFPDGSRDRSLRMGLASGKANAARVIFDMPRHL